MHSVTWLCGASGVMSAVLCAQSSCQAWQLCQDLSLASVHAALCLFMRLELLCITKPFARWICNSFDRSQGRAITQTLAESAASPASGKTNKTSWLLWAQQSSSFWVYTHQFVFCSASLNTTTESYPDILYEIKIQAIYMSHCDPLQNRFSKHSSRSGTISMWLQIIPELC